jgi:hypothetical protein
MIGRCMQTATSSSSAWPANVACMLCAWSAIVAACGFARRHLEFAHPVEGARGPDAASSGHMQKRPLARA